MESKEIHNRIRLLLKKRGISANKMLVDLDINKSFLSDMSAKNTKPSVEPIIKIANYLESSTDYILIGSDICGNLTEDESKLLVRYRKLDDDGKDVVRVVALNEQRRMEREFTVSEKKAPTSVGRKEGPSTGAVHPKKSRSKHVNNNNNKAQ